MGDTHSNNSQSNPRPANHLSNDANNHIQIVNKCMNEYLRIFNFGNANLYPKSNVFWISPDAQNEENTIYQNILNYIPQITLMKYTDIEKAINDLKKIKFEKTFIILSASFSKEFFISLGEILNELKVIPKIIIFTSNEKFILIKQNILSLDKYDLFNINFVYDYFTPVLNELKVKNNIINSNINFNNNNFQKLPDKIFSFEYINDSKQLILPLYLIDFLDIPNQNHIKDFILFLLNNHSEKAEMINLINQLLINSDIPIQILIKYWLRAYSLESSFYKNMNNYLMKRLGNEYDIFIKVLYYGLKQNYITSCIDKDLYRGALIKKEELECINNYLNNKKENLPGCICYNKAFLSTSLEKQVALNFMLRKIFFGEISNNEEGVLYIIKSGEDLYKNTTSNVDLQQFSFKEEEKEILFFPFSCFEVSNIEKARDDYGEYNIIYLLYLGKYKEKISQKEKIAYSNYCEDFLHTTYTDIIELEKEKEKFCFDIGDHIPPESKIGSIIGTYEITNKDLDKNIQILNCCISNKNEIKEICDIYFEGKKINFSFVFTFTYPGKYIFKFVFKQLLKNACKLFAGCKSLVLIDLKNFKTNIISNMSSMFEGCSLIESLDLSNFKTKEVITMKNMFYDCKSLKKLDISNFNTSKVMNMNNMFGNCSSLTFLNLTNFNTQNVVDMSDMFKGCSSLIFINLSSFNTEKILYISGMFYGCSSLTSLNISNFQISKKVNINNMIGKCDHLTKLYLSKYFADKRIKLKSISDNSDIFKIIKIENNENINDDVHKFSSITHLKSFNESNNNKKNRKSMFEHLQKKKN